MIVPEEEYKEIKQKYIEAYKSKGWKEITPEIKNGTMYLLLLEKSETPLQDSFFSVSLGINNFIDNEVDEWKVAGWCWSHDSFTQDETGIPLLYKEFENNIITEGLEHCV